MQINEIRTIRAALSGFASEKPPETYALVKNLTLADRAIKHANEELEKLQETHFTKDVDGRVKTTKRTEAGAEVEEIYFPSPEARVQYLKELKEYNREDRPVKWHKILKSKLDKFVEDKRPDANNLAPLWDVIIVESLDETEQKAEK